MTGTTTENTQTPEQIEQEADDAFNAGYNEQRGESQPSTTTPTETEPVATEAPAADPATGTTAPAPDDWAGVPAKVKAEFEAMQAKLAGLDRINDQLRGIHGHIGGLTTSQQQIRAALDEARTAAKAAGGAGAPSATEVHDASGDEERWNQLREDYPDWAEAMDKRFAALEAKLSKAAPPADASTAAKPITAEEVNQRVANAETRARTLARIDAKHEGWETTIASKEFRDWEQKQSAEVKALAGSANPADAIRMLDLYADHAKRAQQRTEQDARLKRATQATGVAVTTHVEDADAAFEDGYNAVRSGAS